MVHQKDDSEMKKPLERLYISEQVEEALNSIYIELNAGQVTAYDALRRLQQENEELRAWLDASLELEAEAQARVKLLEAMIQGK